VSINTVGRNCFILLRTRVYDTLRLSLKCLDSIMIVCCFLKHSLRLFYSELTSRVALKLYILSKIFGGTTEQLSAIFKSAWCQS
jgi:hypothetical protein